MSNTENGMQLIFKRDDDIWDTADTPREVLNAENAIELYAMLSDSALTWEAANALGRMGEAGIDYLIKGLTDPNDYIQLNTARVLMHLKNPSTVEALIASLSNEDWDVIQYVARALAAIGDDRALEPLSKILYFEPIGLHAADAIATFGEKGADILFDGLKSENKTIRLVCTCALEKVTDKRTFHELVDMVQDPDGEVRDWAVRTLGERKEPEALPILLQLLKKPEDYWAYTVITAIAKIDSHSAIEPFIYELWSTDVKYCEIVLYDLREITGQDFGLDINRWRAWWATQQHD